MSDQQTSITQDLEQLFKKTIGANKIFLTESTRFIKQLSTSKLKGEDLISSQKQLLQDGLNMLVKLSIQHTSNLIDLGLAITARMNQQFESNDNVTSQTEGFTAEDKPAFVLNISGIAGTTMSTRFLLDSDKKDPIICQLKQTEYMLQSDPSVRENFKTTFSPQSFQLLFGKSQQVDIQIDVPAETREGVYQSNILVHGFEHTFFSLILTIAANKDSVKIITKPKRSPKKAKKK